MAVLYRTNPNWTYMNTTTFGQGKNISESNDLVMESLGQTGFDYEKVKRSLEWKPGADVQFKIKKDEPLAIPTRMRKFTVGLGWKVSKDANLDMDVSMLMMDKKGKEIGTVYYGRLKSTDLAVVHHGDN